MIRKAIGRDGTNSCSDQSASESAIKGQGETPAVTPAKLPWKYSVNVDQTKALIVDEDGYTVLELENKFEDGKRFEAIVRGIVEGSNFRAKELDEAASTMIAARAALKKATE